MDSVMKGNFDWILECFNGARQGIDSQNEYLALVINRPVHCPYVKKLTLVQAQNKLGDIQRNILILEHPDGTLTYLNRHQSAEIIFGFSKKWKSDSQQDTAFEIVLDNNTLEEEQDIDLDLLLNGRPIGTKIGEKYVRSLESLKQNIASKHYSELNMDIINRVVIEPGKSANFIVDLEQEVEKPRPCVSFTEMSEMA